MRALHTIPQYNNSKNVEYSEPKSLRKSRLFEVVHNFNIPYYGNTYQNNHYLFLCLRPRKTRAAEPPKIKSLIRPLRADGMEIENEIYRT